ncbi:hypothetical protein J9317_04955 [Metabacillus sp. KIGAM252]|uniref:Uncharacterized protein n=1 Tax=Metabacillus flavus TaxID=2823519 RepID=A0ABS5LC53_9BACI|nr:hypothetical protein [Metabacillus flavus]MBS2968103.1 hypothetical protein [Metabacillus flavus]
MKFSLSVLLLATLINPLSAKAVEMPCSMILTPPNQNLFNAKGAALLYKVKLTPSFPRTSISLHALHLPAPRDLGNFDSYEGFAFIPGEISWRFSLYPSSSAVDPVWAGKIDSITAGLEKSKIQVRPSNTKSGQLGPSILSGSIQSCH